MEKAIKSYSGAVRIAVVVILAMCIGATPLLAQNTAKGKRNKSALESVGGVPILTFTPGIASTTAGTGVSGYSGDGGLATSAQFNSPTTRPDHQIRFSVWKGVASAAPFYAQAGHNRTARYYIVSL